MRAKEGWGEKSKQGGGGWDQVRGDLAKGNGKAYDSMAT